MKKPLDYILLYAKGLSMGAVDIIPGISGGTVAFITGIYTDLITALCSIDGEAWSLLKKLRFTDFWQKINGNFLLTLFAGILTSVLLIARGMAYLLRYHSIPLWAFFFGLILIAAPLTLRKITKWNGATLICFCIGIVFMYGITRLPTTSLPGGISIFFLAGILTACGIIVPGVSGAFLLVLIGRYQAIIHAVSKFNISILFLFVAGCAVGLLVVPRIISWTMDNYYNSTVALLAGFMVGSLNKVWPWREPLEYATYGIGEQVPTLERSILPWDYVIITGKDPHIFQAILMMALGVFIIVLTERITVRLKTKI